MKCTKEKKAKQSRKKKVGVKECGTRIGKKKSGGVGWGRCGKRNVGSGKVKRWRER